MNQLRSDTQVHLGLSDRAVAECVLAALLRAGDDTIDILFEHPIRGVTWPRILLYVEGVRETEAVSNLLRDVLPLCATASTLLDPEAYERLPELEAIRALANTAPQSVRPVSDTAVRETLLWLSVAVCVRLPACIECMHQLVTRVPASFGTNLFDALNCADPLSTEAIECIMQAVTDPSQSSRKPNTK